VCRLLVLTPCRSGVKSKYAWGMVQTKDRYKNAKIHLLCFVLRSLEVELLGFQWTEGQREAALNLRSVLRNDESSKEECCAAVHHLEWVLLTQMHEEKDQHHAPWLTFCMLLLMDAKTGTKTRPISRYTSALAEMTWCARSIVCREASLRGRESPHRSLHLHTLDVVGWIRLDQDHVFNTMRQ
jgi:hypothetical protein